MSYLDRLKRVGLLQNLINIVEMFLPQAGEELIALIDEFGIQSPDVMAYIVVNTREGKIKTGCYPELADIDRALQKREKDIPAPRKDFTPVKQPKPTIGRHVKRVPIETFIRPDTAGYRVVRALMESPRTIEELEKLADTRGYSKSRIRSTIQALQTARHKWYLPPNGWELRIVGKEGKKAIYQIFPLSVRSRRYNKSAWGRKLPLPDEMKDA